MKLFMFYVGGDCGNSKSEKPFLFECDFRPIGLGDA
jgi:hypothetical protein